jgi:hypothetical protein
MGPLVGIFTSILLTSVCGGWDQTQAFDKSPKANFGRAGFNRAGLIQKDCTTSQVHRHCLVMLRAGDFIPRPGQPMSQ